MKKIFSLLCATLLVFSASAAPVAKKAELAKKAPVAVEQMQNVQFEQAQIANFDQLSATPELKVINQEAKTKIGPKELAAQSRSVAPKKAPQDYTTTYNYKCGPTEVVVTDLSTPTYNQFKLAITQKAKNTSEYTKETLYDNTVELIIDPDEHSIVGTFTTDDYSIDANTFLKSGSNKRYVSYWENSTITIVSKGGNKYAITDGLLQVESSNGNYLYKYDYCYAADDLNDQAAEKTAFEFTFGEEPTPATWDTIGKSSVKDGVVAYLLGDTEDAAAYNVTTLQKGNSYKMVNLFGSANPAYNNIKDLASYKKAEIEIDATDANNVTIAKQKIGWTGVLFSEVYEIEASNGKLENGVITFAAANIKFYEDGETPYKGYGDLVITLPKEEPKMDTIPVTVTAYQATYYTSSLDWQVLMADAAGNVYSFDIFAPAEGLESGKTYTSDNKDFDLDYTYAAVNKVNDFAVKASFTKTVSATAIEVVAEMTTAANHVYQFSYTEKIIQWTEWKKFAPLGKSTGTWTFGAAASGTCTSNIYVREDKDNSATQQIKVEGWGAEVLSTSGVDLIIDWDTITNVCTIAEQSTGAYQSTYQEYIMISDLNTYTGGTSYPSSYDPATGKFSLAVIYYISKGQFGYGTETLQMKSSEIKPLQYDATDADFSADFSNDDTKVSITGTTATVSATDADLKTLSLEMYVTSGSAQIPAGDYTITDSKEVGTALASEGVSGGYVTASFAGNRNTSGQITTPMWFLVEGNVNVAYNGYIMTLTVAAKNSNGKNINITVTKDYTPVTERDTVDIVSTALKYNDLIASNKVTIYYATDVEGYYLFRVTSNNATSVEGTFKWSDGTINNPNSYFSVSGTDKNYFTDGEFTVVTNNKDIALTGWMIGEDEKYYRLNMSYTTPTERDTLKFSGQGVTISECVSSQTGVQTGWFYQLTDASTGYEFLLQSTVVAEQYGTFSYADKTLGSNYYNVFDPQGNRQQFVEGSITVSNDGSEIVLDGELIAEDEKVYVLHFTQSASVLNYDTDAPFDATFEYTDMSTDLDEGVIGIYATNAEGLTIGLELYADPTATKIPEGVYTISDTQEAGTALQSLGVAGGYLTECWAGVRTSSGISDCWFMVEGTITLSYDEYDKLKVVVDAKNSYGQPVTALVQYVKLEPKNTVDFTDAELYVYDGYVEQYGIMNFYGGNADGYEFDLYAYSNTVAGDFLEAIDFGDCELTSPAGSIGIIDAYEFKVEADGKNLTLTAKVLGSDTVQYNITAIGYLGYIDGDAKEAYEGEFAVEEIAKQQITISKVNYIYIQGLNAAGDKFQLVVEGEMEDEAIAAGEYTNVMASTGYDAQEQLNPSFVTDADNNDWFIQSGKLTVNENGSMVFEGVNSYDASVVINVTVPAPEVTDYYLVGWINNAAYGIEGDIDNFGDYHFVDGKVKATFNDLSYVQVKDNNKQIYGTAAYVAPAEMGNATLVANGPEKIAINGGVEYEYTLVVNEDGSLTLSYEVVKTALDNINANKKAAKAIKNGMIVIEKDGKAYNVLGIAL